MLCFPKFPNLTEEIHLTLFNKRVDQNPFSLTPSTRSLAKGTNLNELNRRIENVTEVRDKE